MMNNAEMLYKAAKINGFRGTYRDFIHENSGKYLNDIGEAPALMEENRQEQPPQQQAPDTENKREGIVVNMKPIVPALGDNDDKILGLEKKTFWIISGFTITVILALAAYFLYNKTKAKEE